jgi:hypothetical protein
MDDIISHVAGLSDAVQHGPAPWSLELLSPTPTTERHIAVYPLGDPEVFRRFTIGTPPGDYVHDAYGIMIWESSADMSRLVDDDDANAAWIGLFEQVRDRFFIQANIALGEPGSYAHYIQGTFGAWSTGRVIQMTFSVEYPKSFT